MLMNDYVIAINKPPNRFCLSLVNYFRKLLREQKVGYAGTLDPMAEGLMVFGIGRNATKRMNEWTNLEKVYRAKILFGFTSDTDDITGRLEQKGHIPHLSEIEQQIGTFIGAQKQVPPLYSAVHIQGKRAYQSARIGKPITLPARDIHIYEIQLEWFNQNEIQILVHCSKGTYIRALARDLGWKLNTYAVLSSLQRLQIGKLNLSQSVSPEEAVEQLQKQVSQATFILEVLPKYNQNGNRIFS